MVLAGGINFLGKGQARRAVGKMLFSRESMERLKAEGKAFTDYGSTTMRSKALQKEITLADG